MTNDMRNEREITKESEMIKGERGEREESVRERSSIRVRQKEQNISLAKNDIWSVAVIVQQDRSKEKNECRLSEEGEELDDPGVRTSISIYQPGIRKVSR